MEHQHPRTSTALYNSRRAIQIQESNELPLGSYVNWVVKDAGECRHLGTKEAISQSVAV
jgi:hypothetical protein